MGFKTYYKMMTEAPEDFSPVGAPKFIKMSDLFYLIIDKKYSSVSISGIEAKTGKPTVLVTYSPKIPASLKTIDSLLISKFHGMLSEAKKKYSIIQIEVTSALGKTKFYTLGSNLNEQKKTT